jgi:hypothetical protein
LDWEAVERRELKMPPIEEIKGKVVKQECFTEDSPSAHSKISGWDYSQSSKAL